MGSFIARQDVDIRASEDLQFKTTNGKSNFVFVDLDAVRERNELLGPNSDEMWVLTGRVNHLWQSLYDDKRKPHLIERYPVSFVEVSPEDAERLGIGIGLRRAPVTELYGQPRHPRRTHRHGQRHEIDVHIDGQV